MLILNGFAVDEETAVVVEVKRVGVPVWCGSLGQWRVVGGRRVGVVGVGFDGIAEGWGPAVGAEGLAIFVLRDVDGLHERLGQVGDGASGSGFYIAADNGGDEAC